MLDRRMRESRSGPAGERNGGAQATHEPHRFDTTTYSPRSSTLLVPSWSFSSNPTLDGSVGLASQCHRSLQLSPRLLQTLIRRSSHHRNSPVPGICTLSPNPPPVPLLYYERRSDIDNSTNDRRIRTMGSFPMYSLTYPAPPLPKLSPIPHLVFLSTVNTTHPETFNQNVGRRAQGQAAQEPGVGGEVTRFQGNMAKFQDLGTMRGLRVRTNTPGRVPTTGAQFRT